MSRFCSWLVVAGCYAPQAPAGSPCDPGPCPSGLVCSPATRTCEPSAVAVDATPGSPPVDSSPSDTPVDAPAGPAITNVFVIVMTHVQWSLVAGSGSAPYINNTLLPLGAHAEGYMNVPGGFGSSEPYNLWFEAGSNLGTTVDNGPTTDHQTTTMHLSTLLDAASISWKTYQEGISGTSCPIASDATTGYYVFHDPFVFFDDVAGNAAYCNAHVRPLSELAGALSSNTVPRYSFIVPSLCHDMHDTCAPQNDPVKQADDWLAATVPQILASAAYKQHGAVLITWDYTQALTPPIGMIVLSPYAKPGYSNALAYDTSSTLRTLQEIFGVTPLMRNAATARSLSDLFTRYP